VAVVCGQRAFVDVGARNSVTSVAFATCTEEGTWGVKASRMTVAVVNVKSALVDRITRDTRPRVASIAQTRERAGIISAASVSIAVV
jgi:hypothetical protein